MNGEGDTVDVSELRGAGKTIGLYFSAHWCPPCKAFTPKLVETFGAVKAAGKQFEMIFISSDRSASGRKEVGGRRARGRRVEGGEGVRNAAGSLTITYRY